jgi:hypothetical protein
MVDLASGAAKHGTAAMSKAMNDAIKSCFVVTGNRIEIDNSNNSRILFAKIKPVKAMYAQVCAL